MTHQVLLYLVNYLKSENAGFSRYLQYLMRLYAIQLKPENMVNQHISTLTLYLRYLTFSFAKLENNPFSHKVWIIQLVILELQQNA